VTSWVSTRLSAATLRIFIVTGFTLTGFLLRLHGFQQSLIGDEFLAFNDIRGRGVFDVIRVVAEGQENTPPLYFLLAWASAKLGDPTVWLRLPSLVLGTATIPLVYAFGLRTVGRRAALVATAFVALSPFATHFSIEARPYATLIFFSVASSLALLKALAASSAKWWAAYALCVSAVLYTHYTGIFVLAAQAVWSLIAHRAQWRGLLLANLGAAVSFLPWLPSFHGNELEIYAISAKANGDTPRRAIVTWLDGVPYIPLRQLPGTTALVMLGVGVVIGLLAGGLQARRRQAGGAMKRPSDEVLLVVLLAVVTPVSLALYQQISGVPLFSISRNLSASLPFAALALGWVLTRGGRAPATVAVALVLTAVGVGGIKTLADANARTPFRAVARFLDEHVDRADAVFQAAAPDSPTPALAFNTMYIYGPSRWATPVGGYKLTPSMAQFELVHQWNFQGSTGIAVGEYAESPTPSVAVSERRLFLVELQALPLHRLPPTPAVYLQPRVGYGLGFYPPERDSKGNVFHWMQARGQLSITNLLEARGRSRCRVSHTTEPRVRHT
jgi:hypothetical protein